MDILETFKKKTMLPILKDLVKEYGNLPIEEIIYNIECELSRTF